MKNDLFKIEIDDESFDDEESQEAKDLKKKITLALVSITQSTQQAQTNLDCGLYTKFLKNIQYLKAMIFGLSDLANVFDLILNNRVEDLKALGVDMNQIDQEIQKIMNLITPAELSQEEIFNATKSKEYPPKNHKKNEDDDYSW